MKNASVKTLFESEQKYKNLKSQYWYNPDTKTCNLLLKSGLPRKLTWRRLKFSNRKFELWKEKLKNINLRWNSLEMLWKVIISISTLWVKPQPMPFMIKKRPLCWKTSQWWKWSQKFPRSPNDLKGRTKMRKSIKPSAVNYPNSWKRRRWWVPWSDRTVKNNKKSKVKLKILRRFPRITRILKIWSVMLRIWRKKSKMPKIRHPHNLLSPNNRLNLNKIIRTSRSWSTTSRRKCDR